MSVFFKSKSIQTKGHLFIGTVWQFRGCEVEMYKEGFRCSCKTNPRTKCNHIKSVEMGILGVNLKEFKL